MDIPLIAGRLPTPQEMWEGGKGLLVNESAARALFPGGTAVGRQIGSGGNFQEVIGVVGDVRQAGLDRPPGPEIYALMGENRTTTKDSGTAILTIAIRTHGKPDSRAIQAIASAVKRYDNSTTGPAITPLTVFLGNTVTARRIAARLGSVFAALSLLLSALGIYGLVTYWVTQRTAEIGVRIALGASHSNVLGLALGHGFRSALIGIGIGLAMSIALARLISSFLYGLPAFDPVTFILAPTALLFVTLTAAFLPALRAIRINPVEALRSE
jgi:ABC-type antimicrobial peptide transport system permease subunit